MNASKLICVLGFALCASSGTPARAQATQPAFRCETPGFLTPPELGKDNLFRATNVVECVLSGTQGRGLIDLERHLEAEIKKASTIHSGPIEETFEGLPALRYEVTNLPNRTGGDTTVRSNEIVASDLSTKIVYISDSLDIQGKGMAQYLKKMTIRYDVIPIGTAEWRVRLLNTVHIQKPWFAPGGAFKSQAEKNAREEFEKAIARLMPELGANL